MDRFIGAGFATTDDAEHYLKSNMDRFIVRRSKVS